MFEWSHMKLHRPDVSELHLAKKQDKWFILIIVKKKNNLFTLRVRNISTIKFSEFEQQMTYQRTLM